MALTMYLILALAAVLVLHSFLSSRKLQRQRGLPHIPLVKFDRDDTQANYVMRTKEIMHQGYLKYTKNGIAFRIRNPIDEGSPQVIIPSKYLDEVKNAPETELSFPLHAIQSFLLEYSGSALPSLAATNVTRIDLNKNLGELVGGLKEECLDALGTVIPESTDWTPLKPWEVSLPLVARMTGRVLVGPKLCSDPEWIQLTIANTTGIMKSAMEIRASYSARWQWLAPWTYRRRKDLLTLRKRAARMIEPLYRERIATNSHTEKHRDAVQWLIDNGNHDGQVTSPAEIADGLLFLYMAGIHSTSATVVSMMYDLIAHSDYIPELLEEIHQVLADSPEWSKQSLAKLRKLDSFMKESQRLHPVGHVTVQRSTVKPFTFHDGVRLPANTHLSFPTDELTHDPDVYPQPDVFDGLRFYHMRRDGDASKFHFATVSNQSTNFGAGFHACPGRFLHAPAHYFQSRGARFRSGNVRTESQDAMSSGTTVMRVCVLGVAASIRCLAAAPLAGSRTARINAPIWGMRENRHSHHISSQWNWATLNATLHGRLQGTVPLARPCFDSYDGRLAMFQPSQCSEVQAQYTSAAYRADLYSGFMHAQNEICAASTDQLTRQCLLGPTEPLVDPPSTSCGQGSVSHYHIPVTDAADVQAAFAFARQTGVTLSIKNSGHDYSGRSSLRGSLALWTRPMQQLIYHPNDFVPAGCSAQHRAAHAITVGAGVNFDQVYRFAHEHNVTFIGGTAPTVGVSGGFAMTGGHGLLTAQFGLGIDRVLEYKIVTADGELRTANACQHQDLFWALRGGGGATYGVVVESTHRVEPSRPLVFASLTLPAPDANFTRLLIRHARRWSLQGWGGPNAMDRIAMANPFLDLPAARASLAEVIDYVDAHDGGSVSLTVYPDFYPIYQEYMTATADAGVGTASFATNRLIPTTLFQQPNDTARLLDELVLLAAEGYAPTLFATPPAYYESRQPSNPPPPTTTTNHNDDDNNNNNNTSTTPAWRDSTWMITVSAEWAWNSTLAEKRAFVRNFQSVTQRLARLAPRSGAYISEADPFTPDWRTAWWGDENYAHLLRIKRKYDPAGLLRCWRCVGWEEERADPDGGFGCLGGLVDV
ncbi:hypothetical protein BO70DRAFT_336994 [Aspergillus heteromorphus CBS 117.55]|uniref:FAD-binding PCMH-type domain-containing protein n=1 Tax=Aspergillus heteromorphus CBS 117.55 TaxID=1448321 RepID=A0A317W9G3_9EURO|nr:uncharacterized protein BO70DRAFT_336994 [Aspergillus heteromorphus CBS 117.55]PWY81892.1 hypothetical protein BO70DRAFT_336994 [Aspergillus heteromorphus CBS 117.55]